MNYKVYSSGFSRETEPTGCRYRYRYRNSDLMQLWMLACPQSAGWASRLETQGRADVAIQVWRPSVGRIPLPRGTDWKRRADCSSTDCMRPIHIIRAMCFTKSPPISMLISSKHIFTETTAITFEQISGHCGPVNLTHNYSAHEKNCLI